jgi:hypothetical protein
VVAGEHNREGSALVHHTRSLDFSAMIFHDTFTDRQANARAAVLLAVVEPLKNRKNLVNVLLLTATAVVFKNQFYDR